MAREGTDCNLWALMILTIIDVWQWHTYDFGNYSLWLQARYFKECILKVETIRYHCNFKLKSLIVCLSIDGGSATYNFATIHSCNSTRVQRETVLKSHSSRHDW